MSARLSSACVEDKKKKKNRGNMGRESLYCLNSIHVRLTTHGLQQAVLLRKRHKRENRRGKMKK